MSGNRFEFLEFGEDGKPQSVRLTDDAGETHTLPAAREPQGPRDPEGRPLAQVRPSDLPGYNSTTASAHEEADTSRVRPKEATRLRVAEVIGSRGTRAGQFNFPTGLALDRGGVLYVADSYNHRLQRITPNGGVALVGGRGGGRGQFLSPQGVTTDALSAFYVVEQGNNRVQKFSSEGVLQLVFGRGGGGADELRNPTGIAVAPGTGDIFVADTGNSRVQRFDSDGNFLATLGARGGLYPPLIRPHSLAIDGSDNVYVADTYAHKIVQYDPLGRLMARTFGPELHKPQALAWDPLGLLYVTDTTPGQDLGAEGRLQAVDLKTRQARAVVGRMNGAGSLAQPGGVAVSGALNLGDGFLGEVYVADTLNHRILRFAWS